MNQYNHSDYLKLQKKHGAKELLPVIGTGYIDSPKILFLFMNPTGKNISAYPDWRGIQAPWLGTKNVWKIFFKLGIISKSIFDETQSYKASEWTPEFSEKVYEQVTKAKMYITNLAKCTQVDARPLNDKIFKEYLPSIRKEILKVNPQNIVSFGNQVSSVLLEKTVKVSNYNGNDCEELIINKRIFKVYPTFYPVGQGMRNMDKAVKRIKGI